MSTIFQQAFERLLCSAPGAVFPRARRLYFDKFSLEPPEDLPEAGGFRTFLWSERIEETPDLVRVSAERFAVVHWQGPALPLEAYGAYLQERWDLSPNVVPPGRGLRQLHGPGRLRAAAAPAADDHLIAPPPRARASRRPPGPADRTVP
jgi:hypothetical protein